jgi:hypothetical protein
MKGNGNGLVQSIIPTGLYAWRERRIPPPKIQARQQPNRHSITETSI